MRACCASPTTFRNATAAAPCRFRAALTRVVTKYAEELSLAKKDKSR